MHREGLKGDFHSLWGGFSQLTVKNDMIIISDLLLQKMIIFTLW